MLFKQGGGDIMAHTGRLINGDFMNGDLRMNILIITTRRVCDLLMCSVSDVATLSLSSVIASASTSGCYCAF